MGQAVRLRYVEVQGFRSICERQRLEFDDCGLVLFRGESGHGKSSFLLAIAHALDFCPIPATAMQCWEEGSPPLEVEVGLSTAEGDAVVIRGARNQLKVGDAKPLKAAKAIKDRLQQLLGGLPPDLRRALTYRGQRQPGLFLSMTDGEKKDFLTQVLDLKKYEKQIDVAEVSAGARKCAYEAIQGKAQAMLDVIGPEPPLDLVDEAEVEEALADAKRAEESARNQVSLARNAVQEAKLREQALAAKSREQFGEQIVAAQAEVDAIWATLTAFTPDVSERNRLALLQENCASRIKAAEVEDQRKRRTVETEKAFVYERVSATKKQLGAVEGLLDKLAEKESQLARLVKNECPTCLRPWVAAEKAEKVGAEIYAIKSELTTLDLLSEQLPALEQQYRALQHVPDPVIAQLQSAASELRRLLAAEDQKINSAKHLFQADVEKRVAEAEARQAVLEAQAQRAYVAIVNDPLRESKRLQEIAEGIEVAHQGTRDTVRLFAEKKSEVVASNSIKRAAHKRWNDQNVCAAGVCAQVSEALDKYNAERDYHAMLKGFLGGIFAEILDEISDEANKVLGGFPNTADCTVRFSTEKENQDGTTKQSITALLTIRGHEADYRYHASGGQLTSVELAVDMAVARVVSRRTGAYLGWLILDESFNGHTKSVKESCLEILRTHAQDNLVIIVDHATEFKEMFTRFVDVEMVNGRTTATCNKAAA